MARSPRVPPASLFSIRPVTPSPSFSDRVFDFLPRPPEPPNLHCANVISVTSPVGDGRYRWVSISPLCSAFRAACRIAIPAVASNPHLYPR